MIVKAIANPAKPEKRRSHDEVFSFVIQSTCTNRGAPDEHDNPAQLHF